jgi:hypothetical protein
MINIGYYIIIMGLYGAPFLFKSIVQPTFVSTSYYFMCALLLWWVASFHKYAKNALRDMISNKKELIPIFLTLLFTIFCFIGCEVSFKVNSDETNLLGISHSMFFSKTVYNETMGKFYYGNFNVINAEIPKRPLFFPFITSVVHHFIGYSKYSPFIVNFFAIWGSLFLLVKGFVKFNFKEMIALCFLIFSWPIFAIYGTSAGFDTLSVFFFLLSIKLTYEYYQKGEAKVWNFLIPTLLIFSYIRYESILFAGLMLLFLLASKCYNFKDILKRHSLKFFLIFYWPQVLQRILSVGTYENPSDRGVFSFISLKEHLSLMTKSLVSFDSLLPYNNILNFLSLFFIIGIVCYIFKTRKVNSKEHAFTLFLIIIGIINTLLFLSHHAGLYDHPTQARFFFYFCLLSGFSFVYIYKKVSLKNKQDLLLLSSFFFFLLYFSNSIEGRFMNKLVINRDLRFIYNFIDKQEEKNNLYIYDRPGQITALNKGAVNFQYAKENWSEIKENYKSRLFSNVYIISKERYTSKIKPFFNDNVELIQEAQSTSKRRVRIYKLK